jgi:hypothetical protein
MDALPIRAPGPHQPAHRAAHRPAHRGAATGKTKHAAVPHAAHAAAPATPADLDALAQQASFDAVASARAEQQREMNVLRDLAMQQVKRDDQTLNEWVKLI